MFDFTGADLVVRNLSQLSFMNMKRLFAEESLVESRMNPLEDPSRNQNADDVDDVDDYADDDDEGFLPMRGAAAFGGRW